MSDAGRWAQVTAVFQEALERDDVTRAAYLEAACAGDGALRAEVESLLAAHQAAGRFAEGSPLEALAPSAVEALGVDTRLIPGSHLGAYEIAAPLGAGGMGEVYRARDTRLHRDVALKVLPDHVARERDRLARFTREAQILAALNHPNIVTVHSVEEDRGVHFITMELVKGQTLAALLPRNGFALDRFFDLAIPLADAVAAAHAQGIVHRDLKPANVMVTAEGRVKVLDFGLARPTMSAAHGPGDVTAAPMTEWGAVVGTRGYLSPEQARGQVVDARSDMFALGIILYEMLTGRRPFAGDTPTDVLTSVIKDDPPAVSSIRVGLPRELSSIIRRCLAKDPARRLQSALDLRNELEDLRREIGPSRGSRITGSRILIAACTAAAATLAIWVSVPSDRMAPATFHTTGHRPLSDFPGGSGGASFSPDGRMVAFHYSDLDAVGPVGNFQIWVKNIAGGQPLQLTFDDAPSASPVWSPKGDQIYFNHRGGIWSISPLGGIPRLVIERGAMPGFSTDSEQMVFEDVGGIWVARADGSQRRRITEKNHDAALARPALSPDGRTVAFFRAERAEAGDVWVAPVETGTPRQLTFDQSEGRGLAWTPDGRFIIFSSSRGGSQTLWRIPAEGGTPEPVTSGAGQDRDPDVSRDGRQLVYSNFRVTYALMLIDRVTGREQELAQSRRFVSTLRFAPDDTRIAFAQRVDRDTHLFTLDLNTKQTRQVTEVAGQLNLNAQWSADGEWLYFFRSHPAASIRRISRFGGHSTEVASLPGADLAEIDPVGNAVAYLRVEDRKPVAVVVRNLDGGREVLLDTVLYNPRWSPNGEAIVGWQPSLEGDVSRIVWCVVDRPPCRVVIERGLRPMVSRDGSRILYVSQHSPPARELWSVRLDGSDAQQIGRIPGFSASAHSTFDVSRRGDIVYSQRRETRAELWHAEFR